MLVQTVYKLDDRSKSDDCETRFGKRSIQFSGTLIIGRDQHIDLGERLRLEWRRSRVVIDSKQVNCITYDELLNELQDRLDCYLRAAQAGG